MKRFLSPFVIVFTILLAAVTTYLGFRLAESWLHWGILLVLSLLVWSLPVIHWASDSEVSSRLTQFFQQLSFIAMGVLSWILVFTFLGDVGIALSLALPNSEVLDSLIHFWRGTPIFCSAVVFTAFGIWRAQKGLRIHHVNIVMSHLPEELDGFRIAQVSDLHVGTMIGSSYVKKVVSLVNSLNPHLTVLTGDIVDGNLKDLESAVDQFSQFSPAGRVYYVPGNHEYYWSIDQWIPKLTSLGLQTLFNRGEMIQYSPCKIWISGITDPAASQFSKSSNQGFSQTPWYELPNVSKAAQGGESANFRILLSHRPGVVNEAERAGFDLQLSGHTHGGQFFPWTFVAKLFHKFFLGLMRSGKLWVYVSPGTGSWGPPIRIGTTPEVTCLRLSRS